MRRLSPLVAVLALAGCGADTGGAPDTAAGAENQVLAASPAAAALNRSIGTVSSLSAQTSGLKGEITGFQVTQTDTKTVVALAADTLFEFDKADLAPAAVANLQRTAELVRQGAPGAVIVTGYTDAKGGDAYNQTLSQRRAEAVAAWLKTQDDLGTRLFTVIGKGESGPVAPNALPDGSDNPDGRARNRRVEVEIPRA